MISKITIFILIVFMSILWGCSQPLNSRLTLGGDTRSPTFELLAELTPIETSENDTFRALCSQIPDRDLWTITQYNSPFDGVAHCWHMLPNRASSKIDTPRHYGNYPTLNSATQFQTTHTINDVLLIPMELGRSLFASPLLSIRFAPDLFSKPTLSPMIPYKRTHQTYTWSSVNPQSVRPDPDSSTQPQIEQHNE